MTIRQCWIGAALLVLGCSRSHAPMAVAPQEAGEQPDRALATRAELETLAQRLEQSHQDEPMLAEVRARLRDGDFRPGDRVLLEVQRDSTLSDTFAVWPDRQLHLPSPIVGALPLRGVLRSELEPTVTTFIARFVRNPTVRARALLRLSVQGEVVHAGYHAVPADAALSDALTAAGGTTANANVSGLKIERGGRRILSGDDLERAFAAGRTMDEVGVREGDQFIVPKKGLGLRDNMGFVWLMVSITVGALAISRAL